MADMAIMNLRDMTDRFVSSRSVPKPLFIIPGSFKDIVTTGTSIALISPSPLMFIL